MALSRTLGTAQILMSGNRIRTLPPPHSTQRHLLPSLVSSPRTLNPTTSLFPSKNPLPLPPGALTQRSGGMDGVRAKRKTPKNTPLQAWSGKIRRAHHPLPILLAEEPLRPGRLIEPMFPVRCLPGPMAQGQWPDLEFTETIPLQPSLVRPSNARSMT